MKVLITGGAGFIGSHLADALIARGDEVFVLDDLSTATFDNIQHLNKNPAFHCIIDSVLNESRVYDLVQDCDVIYHLAAAVGVRLIVNEPIRTIESNVFGTDVVLKIASRFKKKILIASSSEVYGKSGRKFFKEDDDCIVGASHKPRWAYAVSKLMGEYLAISYSYQKKLPVVIVRLFNTIGPRQTGRYGMVVPSFIEQALKNHPLTIYRDGKQTRCFISVRDTVQALMRLMDLEKSVGQVFNVGSNEEISIADLAQLVLRLTKSKSPLDYIPYQEAYGNGFEDMQRRMPDISKIRQAIGFEPQMRLEEILKWIIADAKANLIKEPITK